MTNDSTAVGCAPSPATPQPCVVPAVGFEEHYWTPSDDGWYSRSARRRATGPYRSTVPARIAGISPSIPADLAADLDEATQALAAFDGYAARRLDSAAPAAATGEPHTVGLLSAILLRTESTSSSRIENLTVGARRLAQESLDGSEGGNAALIMGNVRAMEAALKFADNLDEAGILAMHRALLGGEAGWEGKAGRYRDTLVWVGTTSAGPRGASHVAPQPEEVPACMADLVRFIGRDDLPALAQCAIAHAQFETIHPFADGNGRVGRALVHAILRGKGLTPSTTPPVSAGLLHATDEYFAALTAYRAGDARPILECFAAASRFAATGGMRLIDTIGGILDDGAARLKALPLRADALGWRLLPLLAAQPIVNTKYVSTTLNVPAASATRAIDQLARAGILVERTGARRDRAWEAPAVTAAFDGYAASIRRR